MKVIWSWAKDIAIPVDNISCFEIATDDEWSKMPREEQKGGKYYVIARYTICTGTNTIVFRSHIKEDCISFIENI